MNSPQSIEEPGYYVYLLHCADDSLYCGIARDPEHRLKMHNSGKGAKYTRSRRPCELVLQEGPYTRGDALSREAEIKALSRAEKEEFILKYY
ncbi:MAG: GIY-YIG nuclease family protein [Clostridiales bacterium]|nr:GIY-YIG nuclease family protein [Clostridiales bacterium]